MALVPRRVSSDDWRPVGVDELEANALEVVRSINNRSVIAGPGSGKTELLAQRAAYLLQTGVARTPRRILAISYKRDAARNLAARVRSRCRAEQAYRFDSLTFDAFAKGLVDRFGQALPKRWRPTSDYEIANANYQTYREFLQTLTPPPAIGKRADIIAISVKDFERNWLLGSPLQEVEPHNPSPGEWAAGEFWRSWLQGSEKSYLTFAMIGRLAGLLVKTNPMVRQALRLTYSYLFMDEFQDTTQVQYDLAKEIFFRSETIVTAVGDHKQQIMRWAMAMDDPFTPFESDFGAQRTPLFNNYRSSPELVGIQDVLAKALDAKSSTPVSKVEGTISGDSCAVWDFSNLAAEADKLGAFVAQQMNEHKLSPRDFSILERQKAGDYMKTLEPAFNKYGLPVRNEALQIGPIALQELLSEDLSEFVVALLRLFTSDRAGRHWTTCLDMMCDLRGLAVDDDADRTDVVRDLDSYSRQFRATNSELPANRAEVQAITRSLIDFIGRSNILAASPAYRQGDWFEKVTVATILHLEKCCRSAKTWAEALDLYEGLHAVPLMTVHKSKGLEYHTVIFVGLDDDAWWSFDNISRKRQQAFSSHSRAQNSG